MHSTVSTAAAIIFLKKVGLLIKEDILFTKQAYKDIIIVMNVSTSFVTEVSIE